MDSQVDWHEKIRDIDDRLISEGYELSQRHLRAHFDFYTAIGFQGPVHGTPEAAFVDAFFEERYPGGDIGMGSLAVGGAAYFDQIYLIRIPIIFGRVKVELFELIDLKENSWENIQREKPSCIHSMAYTVGDMFDAAMAGDLIRRSKDYDADLIRIASSHLESAVQILSFTKGSDAAHENIHLAAELSLKSSIHRLGVPKNDLKNYGHNLRGLAEKLSSLKPSKADSALVEAASSFPHFVKNRYEPNLRRIDVVHLLLRAQFVISTALVRFLDDPPSKVFNLEERFQRPPFEII